jgi:hypothetical protein
VALDCAGQNAKFICPPLGIRALVDGINHQHRQAPGRLTGCIEDSKDVVQRAVDLNQHADLGKEPPRVEVLSENHERR